MTTPLTILALDQSTEATGVAVVQCGPDGCRAVATTTLTAHTSGDTLKDRLARLRSMRRGLSAFLGDLTVSFDLVAYEQPFLGKQAQNWEASPMCLGVLLSLSDFDDIDMVSVGRQAACKVAGCADLYREGVPTEKARKEKRARLKAAVIDWARECLGLTLADDDDAIADACAVGVAAWEAHCEAERKAAEKVAQKPMFGPGSGKPRAKR